MYKRQLQDVSFDIEPGEFFGLLGPNGAGKTTLINVVAGLARADAGAVSVMGADTATEYRRARRMLGVVPQELVFDPFFTVRETLRLQSGYFGMRENDAWIEEVMHHLDLTSKANANMRSPWTSGRGAPSLRRSRRRWRACRSSPTAVAAFLAR